MKVETMRYKNGRLHLIDQRVLPEKIEYLEYDSAQGVVEAIRTMVVRGAPAIGVSAAFGIAIEAKNLSELFFDKFKAGMEIAFVELSKSRPTAVNLFWALEKMKNCYQQELRTPHLNLPTLAQNLLSKAQEIYREDVNNNLKIGEHGEKLFGQNTRVLTHCNAGALATAGHGTALGVIRSAVSAGKKISVIAGETRPFLQGARLTAWEMVQEKIPTTLITDNMAGFMMANGEVDAVIVGADRVAANGDTANKIGTLMLAVLAQHYNIPFYVACPISTIDINTATGAGIPIEERNIDEVKGFRDYHWAAEGVNIRNPAFDITPANLISAIITEKGIIKNPDREKIIAHCNL